MEVDSAGVDVFMGFGSLANRRPRSNVYGVGRSTATSSFTFVFPAGKDIVVLGLKLSVAMCRVCRIVFLI